MRLHDIGFPPMPPQRYSRLTDPQAINANAANEYAYGNAEVEGPASSGPLRRFTRGREESRASREHDIG